MLCRMKWWRRTKTWMLLKFKLVSTMMTCHPIWEFRPWKVTTEWMEVIKCTNSAINVLFSPNKSLTATIASIYGNVLASAAPKERLSSELADTQNKILEKDFIVPIPDLNVESRWDSIIFESRAWGLWLWSNKEKLQMKIVTAKSEAQYSHYRNRLPRVWNSLHRKLNQEIPSTDTFFPVCICISVWVKSILP